LRKAPLAFMWRELGIDLAGPVVGRPGSAGPAGLEVEVRPLKELRLLRDARGVSGDALGRNPVEVIRVARPNDRGAGGVRLDELAHAAERPGSDDAERFLRAVLEARAFRQRVVIRH